MSSPDEEAFNWVAVNYVLENFFKVKDFQRRQVIPNTSWLGNIM